MKHISVIQKREEPLVVSELREEKQALLDQQIEINALNQQLIKKLNSNEKATLDLTFITPPKSAEDLIADKYVSLEAPTFRLEKGHVTFKANLVNEQKSGKKTNRLCLCYYVDGWNGVPLANPSLRNSCRSSQGLLQYGR